MAGTPNSTLPPLTVGRKHYRTVLRWDLRREIRRHILFTLIVLAGVWFHFRTPLSATVLRVCILFVAIYLIRPFIRGAYLLHKNGTRRLDAGYKFVDAENAISNLWKHDLDMTHALGFLPAAYLEKQSVTPGVKIFCCLLAHPKDCVLAQVAVVKSSLNTTYLLVFNTAFDDGLILETSYSLLPPHFRAKSRFHTFHFPRVRPPKDLYLLHRKLVKEHTQSRKPLELTPDQAVAKFLADAEEVHTLNVTQGNHKLSAAKDRYVYTWKGAFKATFRRTWPVTLVRNAKFYAESDRTVKRLGFRYDVKSRRLVDIDAKTNKVSSDR